MIRSLFFITVVIFLSSCKNDGKRTTINRSKTEIEKEYLIGSWEDTSASALHFTLFEDGTARSDNMETLLYKSWKVNGDQITFSIESIGNGTSSTDNVTYVIEKLTKDELILRMGTHRHEFQKRKKHNK